MKTIVVKKRGYNRRSYVRHLPHSNRTVRVKGCYVKPTTYNMVDRGEVGHGKRIITNLKKNDLKRFGYTLDKSEHGRWEALNKALKYYVKKLGNKREANDKIIWKLNAIRTLTKNTEPQNYPKLTSDIKFLQSVRKLQIMGGQVRKKRYKVN